jgi:hypothetical protein
MEPPSATLVVPEHLPLSQNTLSTSELLPMTELVLAPSQLWTSLSPLLRLHCHQSLARILKEVFHDAAQYSEDHTCPS